MADCGFVEVQREREETLSRLVGASNPECKQALLPEMRHLRLSPTCDPPEMFGYLVIGN
jgi:hypothetical protein